MRREQEPQRERQRQHPLAQRSSRQHLIGEQRRRLRLPSRAAARAKAAPLAAERDELLGMAALAAHAQEAELEAAALEMAFEFLLHIRKAAADPPFRARRETPGSAARRAGRAASLRVCAAHSPRIDEQWRTRRRGAAVCHGCASLRSTANRTLYAERSDRARSISRPSDWLRVRYRLMTSRCRAARVAQAFASLSRSDRPTTIRQF